MASAGVVLKRCPAENHLQASIHPAIGERLNTAEKRRHIAYQGTIPVLEHQVRIRLSPGAEAFVMALIKTEGECPVRALNTAANKLEEENPLSAAITLIL